MALTAPAPSKADLALLQQAQRLYGVGGAAVPLQLKSNTLRTLPVGYRFQVAANAAAGAVVAELNIATPTIIEDAYVGLAAGYLSSAGNNNGSWQGWIFGASADVSPYAVGAAASLTKEEFSELLAALNLSIVSGGLTTEVPLREALKVFPNVATGNLSDFATGACPGSGVPTLAIPGGVPWLGDQNSKVTIVANRAFASGLGWSKPVNFNFRLWMSLALLGTNAPDADVSTGSMPRMPICGDTMGLADAFANLVVQSRGR